MKKKNLSILLITLSSFVFASCSAKKHDDASESAQVKIDKMILDAAIKVQASQAALFQAGALNSVSLKSSLDLDVRENLYSIVWYGDAIELLTKMAHDQKIKFKFTGVRLPLPLAIKSIDASYDDILSLIKSQIGYRAELTQSDGSMFLRFNHPGYRAELAQSDGSVFLKFNHSNNKNKGSNHE